MESANFAQNNTTATVTVEKPMIELPLEIYAYIIDSLDHEENASTIANCALVCRAWLPFSRHKLYSAIDLRYHRQWISFRDFVLQSKSETVSRYLERTQELYVWLCDEEFIYDERTQRRIGWNKGKERPWAHLALVQCATRLTGLRRIYLSDVDLSPSHDMAILSGCNYYRLTTLSVMQCTFTSIHQLMQFVASFPALSDLSLWALRFRSKIEVMPSDIPNGGHPLTRLELAAVGPDVVAAVSRWLTQVQLVRNLEYLFWQPYMGSFVEEALQTFTKHINGPFLRELHCWISDSSCQG